MYIRMYNVLYVIVLIIVYSCLYYTLHLNTYCKCVSLLSFAYPEFTLVFCLHIITIYTH